MTEKGDHNWDAIIEADSTERDGLHRTQRMTQLRESREELLRLLPGQRRLSDSSLHHGMVSGRGAGTIKPSIPTSGLALLSEAASDKSFNRPNSKKDSSADLMVTFSPNSHIPPVQCSSLNVPKYPHPGPHLLKAFRDDLVSTSSVKQVPVKETESFSEYSDQTPYDHGHMSKFSSNSSFADTFLPNQGALKDSFSGVDSSQSRSQFQMTNTFPTSSDRLMPPTEPPFCDVMKEGLYRRINETSPSSFSSTSVGQESQQSSSDSWEMLGRERRNRADSAIPLDIEVIDLHEMTDRDLQNVVSSLGERETVQAVGSCGTSPTSTSSTPSPSSPDADSYSDLRNHEGALLQKISRASGVFRTKYFPACTSPKLAETALNRVLPRYKHKQPSSTVTSACSESDTACEAISGKGFKHPGKEIDVDSDVDNSNVNSEQLDVVLKKEGFCQVCSDIAAGFYCGAYICEACKKFFVRASRQEKIKYVCHKSENCEITKETRVRCQYCRYQKCLKLNMYSPGGKDLKQSGAGISNIPCRVCGGATSGFHFGALTCEGCKGFFRRMAKEREWTSYRCSKDNNCEISMLTRNVCKACRYRKCLEAGMSVEASRIGRQPNAVKHAISVEARKQETRTADGRPGSSEGPPLDFAAFSRAHCKVPPVQIKKEVDLEEVESTIQQVKEAWKELSTLHTHGKICYDSYNLSCNDRDNTWRTVMVHFEFNAKCVIKFSKKLPKFQTLCIDDQVSLVQMATYSLCILNHSQFYNLKTEEYRFFDFTRREEEAILKHFPPFSIIPKHFRHFGLMLKTPNLDDTELAFLSSLVLLNTENLTLKNKDQVEKINTHLVESLHIYIERNHTDHESRMGYLLLRISELAVASLQHNQCVGAVAKANPGLENQLWDEMYLK